MSYSAKVVVKSATANLVRELIDAEPRKTQEQIAIETGFLRSNVLTMIKQGRTRLPLDKIGPFCKSVGVSPNKLLRTALSEYEPELGRLIGEIYSVPMFDGIEPILDTLNAALSEAVQAAKDSYRVEATDGHDLIQSLRLTGELNLEPEKLVGLKRYIKSNMVVIKAGDDVISPIGTPTNSPS